MSSKTPMRYAHSEGHTDMCFDKLGKYMITGGDDGDVRLWEGIEGDDTVAHVGNKVYAVQCVKDRFFTANDMNSIQTYTFPDCSPDGIVVRFTAPVTHMCLNSDGTRLAAGSSDFTIKVVDVAESTSKSYLGHEAPVLCVSIDPKEELLASSSCDGTVRVWNMEDQSLVKSLSLLPKSNDFSVTKTLCRLAWEPKSGKSLAVPVGTGVEIYSRHDWQKLQTLTDDTIKQDISLLSFSSDGRHLAAACRDGVITIWQWSTKSVVVRTSHPRGHTITALCWNPGVVNQLAYCDDQGQLCLIEEAVPAGSTQLAGSSDASNNLNDIFGDDDDFMLTAEREATKDSDSDGGLSDIVGKPRRIVDDDDKSDITSVTLDIKPVIVPVTVPATVTPTYTGPKPTPLQSPFQPSSTPQHLSSRFMKWNTVGIIRLYNSDEENSIDIEFHDAAIHHAMHISNSAGYTMADLSTEAVLLAAPSHNDVPSYTMADLSTEAVLLAAPSDDDVPSKLQCLHFGSWDNCREWSVNMPDGEDIVAVVIGGTWLAAATDSRYIRLFTVSGVQQAVLSVPGPVVCLAAFADFLFVAYHRAVGLPGEQYLGYQLINVKGEGRDSDLMDHSLPLTPKSTLSWAGFSVQGTPFTSDSDGVIRMMSRRIKGSWTPVANTKQHTKGKSDHYWLVGISENPQQIRCIPCKGARYPPTLPRPALAVLPFELPLCEPQSEKTQYEEVYQRSGLMTQHLDHWAALGYDIDTTTKTELLKPANEAMMKLFALSVRSEHEYRAVDLCSMMDDDHTLQLAIKYVTRLKRLKLAQRIGELAMERVAEQEQAREEAAAAAAATQCTDDTNDVSMEDDFIPPTVPSGPMLKLGSGVKKSSTSSTSSPSTSTSSAAPSNWSNPFKLVSQEQSHTVFKGSQVFDEMSRPSTKPTLTSPPPALANKPKIKVMKKPAQGRLFGAKPPTTTTDTAAQADKKASAYDLWLADNLDDLHTELADLSEEDLQKEATQRFQQLPREQKQVYLQKARAAKSDAKSDKDLENKKRKRDAEITLEASGDSDQKKLKNDGTKKPLAASTNTKLSGFLFNKGE